MRVLQRRLEPKSRREKLEGSGTTLASREDPGIEDVGHPTLRRPTVDSDNGLQQLCLPASRLDEMATVVGASIDIREIEALHLHCLRPEMQFLQRGLLQESAARSERRRTGRSRRDPGNIEADEDAMKWMLALRKVSHLRSGEQLLQQRLRRRGVELPRRQ
jgi:hypothetical protein